MTLFRKGNIYLYDDGVNRYNFEGNVMIKGYLTANDFARLWGLTPRRIRVLCGEGRIPGAEKVGRIWFIPEEVDRPEDGRIKSGKYRNWRNKR